ncbi:MAG: hypothetical protein Ct9H300mP3_00620 [Gammaproteobacteria bacterium]|nr:MAG: hypothetical protein Ct9H300mP3_00620 [Gammaproteobacteria bacterium]
MLSTGFDWNLCGTSTLRFAPALNIPDSEIQEGLFRLNKALKKF